MNDRWQEIRQAALDVLHPDEKTLAHGLELHRNSYVFDAYGFKDGEGVALAKNCPKRMVLGCFFIVKNKYMC